MPGEPRTLSTCFSLDEETISTITMFVPPTGPDLFQSFGLPLILPQVGGDSIS